jgi:uncharacterized membrane protein YdjX (TVP38/TMEM64 family)
VKLLRIIIIAFILLAVGIFFILTGGNDPEAFLFERITVSDANTAGLVILLCAFILLSTLSGLPLFYLSMALGFLLNFTPALGISLGINLVAVMAAFYIVRYSFSDFFRERYGKKKLIKRINKKIGKYGGWTVAFSRAIYIIPTNVINFSFPLSHISVRSYLWGTLAGLIPECLVNVLAGYLIKHEVILLSAPESRTWQVLVIGGFVLLFTAIFVVVRMRKGKKSMLQSMDAIPYKE